MLKQESNTVLGDIDFLLRAVGNLYPTVIHPELENRTALLDNWKACFIERGSHINAERAEFLQQMIDWLVAHNYTEGLLAFIEGLLELLRTVEKTRLAINSVDNESELIIDRTSVLELDQIADKLAGIAKGRAEDFIRRIVGNDDTLYMKYRLFFNQIISICTRE